MTIYFGRGKVFIGAPVLRKRPPLPFVVNTRMRRKVKAVHASLIAQRRARIPWFEVTSITITSK